MVGDGGKELLLVLAVERRLPDEHLVELRGNSKASQHFQGLILLRLTSEEDRLSAANQSYQHSERPPIDGLVVRLVVDDLRRNVVRGAAEGLGHRVAHDLLLAHSEVGYLDVTVLIQ